MTYNFLVLAVLFLIPGALIFALRPDLRRAIGVMSLCALPFALTETLFYPDYWEPKFVGDLIHVLGFGVEDVLFVVGLAAFTSTAWACVTRQRFAPLGDDDGARGLARRAVWLLIATFALVGVVALAGIPMIYGSFGIMVGVSLALVAKRPDLAPAALGGGVVSTAVYTALCVVFGALIPDVFELAWHTDRFLNVFVLGVPVEELMYGFGAGMSASVFYPYVTQQRFAPMRAPAHDDAADAEPTVTTC